jgi:hypothetical protein
MRTNGHAGTAVEDRATHNGNGSAPLSTADVERLFEDGYREIEVLPDGTLREAARAGDRAEETVTRSLKTQRTWY